jgi:hypothetical protein
MVYYHDHKYAIGSYPEPEECGTHPHTLPFRFSDKMFAFVISFMNTICSTHLILLILIIIMLFGK